MDKLHCIHSRNGRIGGRADTTGSDVDAIVQALRDDPRKHLVLHFHGGLVSKEAGLSIAATLQPIYSPAPARGAYPVFYVWESGVWETIRNNLTELADEPVFKQLLRKLVQYALEELGAQVDGAARATPAARGAREQEVRDQFEKFWAAPAKATIPLLGADPLDRNSVTRAIGLNEAEIEADLEQDDDVRRALATLPGLAPAGRSALAPAAAEHRSAFAEVAAHEFTEAHTARGLVAMYKVASFLVKVLVAVVRRSNAGRDHGLYATCVEELVRHFKVAGSGVNQWAQALEWNRMKQDTADAFGPDPDVHAGTALLARLKQAVDQGWQPRRITLVGHSTGAVYIAHWLAASRDFLPAGFKQDIVLLAPAITYHFFARTLAMHGARIGGFRMFAMKDALERDDQVWGSDQDLPGTHDWRRYIYPSSLLYLVSGILETRPGPDGPIDEADVPLLGMERFYALRQVYTESKDAGFKPVDEVREWLEARANRMVWSVAQGGGAGLVCNCNDHGYFDNEPETLSCLTWLVEIRF